MTASSFAAGLHRLRGRNVASRAGSQLSAQWSGRKGGRHSVVALGVVLLFLGWCAVTQSGIRRRGPVPCDAFEQPGRLLVDLSALHTQWRPLDDDACPPLPPYLPALHQLVLGDAPEPRQGRSPKQLQLVASEPLPPLDNAPDANVSVDPLAFLERSRKRPPTVLVLGDATDDDGLDQICSIFQQRTATFPSPPRGAGSSDSRLDDFLYASEGDLAAGQSRRKPALRRCELARADGRGTALRVLGAPFGGSRLAALPLSALEELGGAVGVDVVMMHSGALEAPLLEAPGKREKTSTSFSLLPQQLERWGSDLRRSLQEVRELFPHARIVLRLPYRARDAVGESTTNLHLHALRHLQRETAHETGVAVFDFGRVIEGYQSLEEDGHLALNPAGVVYAQALVHQLRLALESPSSWRRGWLWDS